MPSERHVNNHTPGMILPEGVALEKAKQLHITQLRLNVAIPILAQLSSVDYSEALTAQEANIQAQKDAAEVIGQGDDFPPENWTPPAMMLSTDSMADIAIAYTDALLVKLGLISPAPTHDSSPESN